MRRTLALACVLAVMLVATVAVEPVAAQPNILYGYALVGGIKEFSSAALLVGTAATLPPLLDRRETSLRAVAANPGPMAVWGFIVAAGLVLGSIPLFVGLIVVMPVLGHATWHLYRRVVAR